MALDDIIEIKELENIDEVNSLLSTGSWRLIDVKSEKVKTTETKESGGSELFLGFLYESQPTIVPIENEYIETKYIIGRYK